MLILYYLKKSDESGDDFATFDCLKKTHIHQIVPKKSTRVVKREVMIGIIEKLCPLMKENKQNLWQNFIKMRTLMTSRMKTEIMPASRIINSFTIRCTFELSIKIFEYEMSIIKFFT